MALTKNKKKEVVDELTGLLKDSKTIVFVNFKGLTVGSTNTFRNHYFLFQVLIDLIFLLK